MKDREKEGSHVFSICFAGQDQIKGLVAEEGRRSNESMD